MNIKEYTQDVICRLHMGKPLFDDMPMNLEIKIEECFKRGWNIRQAEKHIRECLSIKEGA